MSASEKLKELLTAFWEEEPPEGPEGPEAIIRALPQIWAVVEAAEEQADLVKDEEIEWRWPELAEALAALEEALSSQ